MHQYISRRLRWIATPTTLDDFITEMKRVLSVVEPRLCREIYVIPHEGYAEREINLAEDIVFRDGVHRIIYLLCSREEYEIEVRTVEYAIVSRKLVIIHSYSIEEVVAKKKQIES